MTPAETTILILLGAGAAAWLMRAFSGGRDEQVTSEGRARAAGPGEQELAEAAAAETLAVTSEGWAFLPDGDAVHLIPPGDPEETWPVPAGHEAGLEPGTNPETQALGGRGAPVNPKTGRRVPGWMPGEHLVAGDLIAARVVRGAPDHDQWRLEALGRDRDYRAWRFETEEAARTALALLSSRIVRAPRDQDGDAVQVVAADFADAQREAEEIERELATEAGESGEDDPR
ncbi:MAG: hypothetical protein HZC42_15270 [Candidatus Eisenbacteria bacterium]|nr:hypothetical protein [Candidatus Eisenbacteria bacterium]